jgi:hypothetical protein
LYLLSGIKPLDALTSGVGRLQSELVQTFLNYFCYELLMNSASLNEFKTTSEQGVNTIGFLLLLGTFGSVFIAIIRAIERLKSESVAVNQADNEKSKVAVTREDTTRSGGLL